MKKITLLYLVLTAHAFCAIETVKGDFIRTLYINRDIAVAFYSACEPKNIQNKLIIPCGGEKTKKYFNSIISNKNLNLTDWYENNKNVHSFFDELYRTNYRTTKAGYALVTNDTLISLAVSLLGDTTQIALDAIKTGSFLLSTLTAYPDVMKHSQEIRKMRNSVNSSTKEYQEILVMTNNNKREADSLLRTENLPLQYRAHLGDTVAEDSLINLFKNEKSFKRKFDLVYQLIFTGSEKSLKTLILKFNEPIYDYCSDGRIINTIKIPILAGFYRLYPGKPIFCGEYSKYRRFETGLNSKENVKKCIDMFLEWAYKTFGIKPEIETENYILRDDCRRF